MLTQSNKLTTTTLLLSTRTPVLPLAVRQKVETGAYFFFKFLFLFHDLPCNITQQLIRKQSGTLDSSREN